MRTATSGVLPYIHLIIATPIFECQAFDIDILMRELADLTDICRFRLSGGTYIGSTTAIDPRKADLRMGPRLTHAAVRHAN